MEAQNTSNAIKTDLEPRSEFVLEERLGTDTTHDTIRSLGLIRWVQFAFVGMALILTWILEQIVALIWDLFAEPKTNLVLAIAILISIGTTIGTYRIPQIQTYATAVVSELSKVTWPTRSETWSATVIVIITSLIAAGILFLFDTMWSSLTDLIYKV